MRWEELATPDGRTAHERSDRKPGSIREALIRHAEKYGTAEVFETALDGGLSIRECGYLALRLQNIDPQWKLTLANQCRFVRALLEAGVKLPAAARQAGVTQATARTWAEDPLEVLDPDPEAALRRASRARFTDLNGIVRGWSKPLRARRHK